ncbi:HupE/UreJ family protein [Piscinibacter koreensis]|uniref:HupE/UreJ family protein n=1 Tax=Piscinibacter koreensis TaxID=2742824 RepID=A0A7Y6TX55_9BURK|nr:HupE/UreJ family protein [Schlegelella koreensis]NUZ06799.1 HupE/UreJ family protein [Schlegelella koreensis]
MRLTLGALLLVAGTSASAHKASDAYLQIEVDASRTAVRWEIALRDLDVALDLDTDGDGALTWREVREAWPRIESYALPRLRLPLQGCALASTARGLERRHDGAYAVLHLAGSCALMPGAPIDYRLFADVDPTHRGIAKITRSGRDLELAVLDPGARPPPAAGSASTGVTAASGAASGPAPRGAAPSGFFAEGVRHILTGYDHVLFLLCLLLPSVMRRAGGTDWQPIERLPQAIGPIVGIVTAFTLAHSITLCLAALRIVSLPASFIEPAIALTIVLAALDNLVPIFPVRRVVVALVFGLIHGFGFASVLAELNLPTLRFAEALLLFNLGLESGQLMIVAVVVAVLFLLRRGAAYRLVVIRGGSCAALVVATLWLVERTADVSVLPF